MDDRADDHFVSMDRVIDDVITMDQLASLKPANWFPPRAHDLRCRRRVISRMWRQACSCVTVGPFAREESNFFTATPTIASYSSAPIKKPTTSEFRVTAIG